VSAKRGQIHLCCCDRVIEGFALGSTIYVKALQGRTIGVKSGLIRLNDNGKLQCKSDALLLAKTKHVNPLSGGHDSPVDKLYLYPTQQGRAEVLFFNSAVKFEQAAPL